MLAAGVAVSSRPQPFIAVAPSRSPVNPRRHRRAGRIISILLAKASAKPPAPPEDSDDSSDVVSSSPSSASASASSASSSPPFPPPPTRAARPLNPSSRAAASKAASAAPPSPPIRARLPTTLPALPFPASEVLVPGQTKRLHLFEARYLALLDEALARRDGCLAHVVAEPVSSLRASSNNYDVTEEYTRFQSGSGSKPSPTSPPPPPPPLVVGSYVLRLATLARVVDVRRPPASSRAPGALVTIRGEARLALLSLEDDSPYLRVSVEAAPDSAPTAEAVCGGGGGGGGCDVEDELEGGRGGEGADNEEDALVAAVLARRAQEVEALLWDVVNLSYKLPRPNAAGSDGNRPREPRRRSNGDLRISNSGRGFDDGEEDEEEAAEEEDEPLSPDPTGTIAALQSALNWAGDVPGLAPLSLSSTAAAAAASASPSPASASASASAAAAAPPSPASPPSLSPLAAAAERGARLGFAALQQVPHAGSPESLRSLAAARAAAMETGDTAERLGLAADFLRKARAELAAKAALKALQLG